MSQPIDEPAVSFLARLRAGSGRRATGIVLTLVFEALLLLLLLTIGRPTPDPEEPEATIVTFSPAPARTDEPAPAENERQDPDQPPRPQPRPEQQPPQAAEQQPPPPQRPLIPLSPNEMAAADIANLQRRPSPPAPANRPLIGPAAPATPADTPLAGGTGPNGEPLYAATWYREPRDDELRGYLSTADGPGWALIACRTVPDYRVEDCVALDEYPRGSHMARAVLAAAWQFRVRPPRIGGRPQIGEWVRIRIDYDLRRR